MRVCTAAATCAASLLFVACSQHGIAADAGSPVLPRDVPHMRPGLWEEVWIFNGQTTPTKKYCDAGRAIVPPKKPGCTAYRITRAGPQTFVFDATCKEGNQNNILHGEFSGDFGSAFSADTTLDAPGLMRAVVHETYRYLGPCPPGLAPKG
jgi:hypothetical protein